MFPVMRIPLLVLITLAIGFALGWISRPSQRTTVSERFERDKTSAPTALPAPVVADAVASLSPSGGPEEIHRTRLDTLRWLKQAGAPIHFRAFAKDGFLPALLKIVGLTPDETARLENAAFAAKRKIIEARMSRAKPSMSDDGKTLIVEVPPIDATTSRAIYENLLDTVKSTLGAERYSVFTELTGESFELGFDQFGLNSLRYELALEARSVSAEGTAYYEYKRHFLDPSGASKGWGGSILSVAQLEKEDPILGHFIPERMKSRPANEAKPSF
jgi:hypothetical protein